MIKALLLTIFLVNMAAPASAYSYAGWYWHQGYAGYCLDSTIPSGWSTPIAQGANAWNNAGANFYFYTITCNNKVYYAGLSENTLARTWTYYSGDSISKCETYFNNNKIWSTSGESGKYDVRSVATHEFGHWLDLYDLYNSTDTEKTMYYQTAAGETKKQTLDSDDIAGINSIY